MSRSLHHADSNVQIAEFRSCRFLTFTVTAILLSICSYY